MNISNPFDQEEMITSWLEGDSFYQKSKLASLQKFKINNNLSTSWTESIQQKYLNFIHFVTKNAIGATLVMLLSLTTVSASAFEAFGPEQYKPSTIISKALSPVNEQPVATPSYQPLEADNDNHVVVLEKCDLAVKIPKKYTPELTTKTVDNIEFSKTFNDLSEIPKSKLISSLNLESEEQMMSEYYTRNISCFQTDNYKLENVEGQVSNQLITDTNQYNFVLQHFETPEIRNIVKHVTCCGVDNQGYKYYIFNHQDKTIVIQDIFPTYQKDSKFDLILQPNSIAPSKSSIQPEIFKAPEPPKQEIKKPEPKPEEIKLTGTKFVGKIGNSEVEVYLNINKNYIGDSSYIYKNQNKPIKIIQKSYDNKTNTLVLEEIVEGQKTGQFIFDTVSNPDFENNIKGQWINTKTGQKLNFEITREGYKKPADTVKNPNRLNYTGRERIINDEVLTLGSDGLGGFYSFSSGSCPSQNCNSYYAYNPTKQTFIKMGLKTAWLDPSNPGGFVDSQKQPKIRLSAKVKEFIDPTNVKIWEIVEIIQVQQITPTVATTPTQNPVEQVQTTPIQEVPKITPIKANQVKDTLYPSSGFCNNDAAQGSVVETGLDAACFFRIKDVDKLKSFPGKIEAEIVAASRFGRGNCYVTKINNFDVLACENVPTGTKDQNITLLNPSDIAIFAQGDEVGYVNGSVQILYE